MPCYHDEILHICRYSEYISVGKGRDVGFVAINGFESKIASVSYSVAYGLAMSDAISACMYVCIVH